MDLSALSARPPVVRAGWRTEAEVLEMLRQQCIEGSCACTPRLTVGSSFDGQTMHANADHDPACPMYKAAPRVDVVEGGEEL